MKNNKNIFLFFYLIIFALYLQAQSPQVKLPETFNNLTLDSFAAKVSDEYKIRIFYDATLMPDVIITFSEGSNEIIDVLQSNLKAYNIEVLADENGNIFLAKDLTLKTRLPDDFFAISQSSTDNRISKNEFADRESFLKTNHEYISKTFIVGTKKAGVYKSEAEITGRILSFNDSLPLVGATLYIDQLQKGAASDVDGFYTITIPKGKYNLKVRNVESPDYLPVPGYEVSIADNFGNEELLNEMGPGIYVSSTNGMQGIADTKINLGKVYLGKNNLKTARKLINEGINTAIKINAEDVAIEGYKALIECEVLSGNYKGAFTSQTLLNSLHDSVYNIEKVKAINELQKKYETEKKEKEIEIQKIELEKKNALNQLYFINCYRFWFNNHWILIQEKTTCII